MVKNPSKNKAENDPKRSYKKSFSIIEVSLGATPIDCGVYMCFREFSKGG